VVENGHTLIRPLRNRDNPFLKFKGALKAFRNRKEINSWVSDLRDERKDD
jgi:hypothetical protein